MKTACLKLLALPLLLVALVTVGAVALAASQPINEDRFHSQQTAAGPGGVSAGAAQAQERANGEGRSLSTMLLPRTGRRASVPEPSPLLLLGTGFLVLALVVFRTARSSGLVGEGNKRDLRP